MGYPGNGSEGGVDREEQRQLRRDRSTRLGFRALFIPWTPETGRPSTNRGKLDDWRYLQKETKQKRSTELEMENRDLSAQGSEFATRFCRLLSNPRVSNGTAPAAGL